MTWPVFADVDTGVDDAMALVYLLASEDAELVGIASTGGNVDVDQVCCNNLGLLQLCGAGDIPVSRGAPQPLCIPIRTAEDTHGPTGLGYAELPSTTTQLAPYDSAEAWVRAAHAHPGTLVGLVSGPMTNLALALRAEPALPSLLRRLVIMGGSFEYRGNTTPVAEWNVSVDPEAAAEVLLDEIAGEIERDGVQNEMQPAAVQQRRGGEAPPITADMNEVGVEGAEGDEFVEGGDFVGPKGQHEVVDAAAPGFAHVFEIREHPG